MLLYIYIKNMSFFVNFAKDKVRGYEEIICIIGNVYDSAT